MVTPTLTVLIAELRDGLKARNAELSDQFSLKSQSPTY